jgi:hypothetical protein
MLVYLACMLSNPLKDIQLLPREKALQVNRSLVFHSNNYLYLIWSYLERQELKLPEIPGITANEKQFSLGQSPHKADENLHK